MAGGFSAHKYRCKMIVVVAVGLFILLLQGIIYIFLMCFVICVVIDCRMYQEYIAKLRNSIYTIKISNPAK